MTTPTTAEGNARRLIAAAYHAGRRGAVKELDRLLDEADAIEQAARAESVKEWREALGRVVKEADAVRDMTAAFEKYGAGHWLSERDLARIRLQHAVTAAYALLATPEAE